MKLDQQQQYITEFKNGLQKQVIKAIVSVLIFFYFLYLLTSLRMLRARVNNFIDNESAYLQVIGASLVDSRKYQYDKILNFLDSSHKLLQIVNNKIMNKTEVCDPQIFDCTISSSQNYNTHVAYYRLLAANAKSIAGMESLQSIFVYNNNSQIFFNMITLGISSYKSILSSTLQAIQQYFQALNISSVADQYSLVNIMLNQIDSLSMLCELVSISSVKSLLCVLIQSQLIAQIPQTSNYYYLTNTFVTIGQAPSLSRFVSIFSGQIDTYDEADKEEDILNCLNNFPSLYSKTTKLDRGIIARCQAEGSLNYFGPYYSFRYYSESIGKTVSLSEPNSMYIGKYESYSFFICSNSSYYSTTNSKIIKTLEQIHLISYFTLFIVGLVLLVSVKRMQAIETSLIPSISLILKLYQLVKGKEEKSFNKLIDNTKPSNFQFLTRHFQQYLWVCRLLRIKGKLKYKKILMRGLELFSEEEYLPVLLYIYSQLINLELERINNLLRIKNLPRKKNENRNRNEEAVTVNNQNLLLPPPAVNALSSNNSVQLQPDKHSTSKRRNANICLLDPDDEQLMRNISMSYQLNHSVRFSNEIQVVQIEEGPIIRKIKFAEALASCKTIKNDLSEPEDSPKRTQFKQSLRSLKQQEESYTSLVQIGRGIRRKSNSFKNRSLESIHGELNNIKFDEEEDAELNDSIDVDLDQGEDYSMSSQAIMAETKQTYESLIHSFQQAIRLRMKRLAFERDEELTSLVNQIYSIIIQKYQQVHEMLRYLNDNKLDLRERERYADFEDMSLLQLSYLRQLRHELVQHGEVLRLQIQYALGLPVSFKNLEFLNKSKQNLIKIQSRQLLSEAAQQYQPHLDWVVIQNSYLNLREEKTTIGLKGRALRVLSDNLERYPSFAEEVGQLKMVRQFYNPKNKKFYFLTSLSSLKPFNALLLRFFELINRFDIINIYNLEQAQSWEQQIQVEMNTPKKKRRVIVDHLKYMLDLQSFLELFSERQKEKESQQRSTSVKTISRRLIYQKEFHEILNVVQNDDVQFSKYIILFLGEEQVEHSGETEDYSSNTNHRPYQQRIHQEITKIINQGYFHFILIGHQLDAYPSRYGRLKRYVKLSPELLEIDLVDREQQDNLKLLEKFIG